MYAILVDVTKCTGCERCVTACVDVNHLDHQRAENDRLVSRDGLSANRFLTIDKVDDGRFARKACMHCVEPSCVSACLVGGLCQMFGSFSIIAVHNIALHRSFCLLPLRWSQISTTSTWITTGVWRRFAKPLSISSTRITFCFINKDIC